jgi:hypothetical protein
VTAISMQPARLDLWLYAGDGFAVLFTFTDKETGDPWPIDGVWLAQVRTTPSSDEIVATFNIDDADVSSGKLTLALDGTQTRAIADAGACVWDMQQVASGAEPRTWYRGSVRVTADVSREP